MPEETVNKPLNLDIALYFRTTVLTVLLSLIIFVYNYFGSPDDPLTHLLSRSFADTALILIGLSLALSGICYFWNFAEHYFIYRKHLGLIGFALALSHGITFLLIIPRGNLSAFISGITALIIYAFMAAISNRFFMIKLGGSLWRQIIRVGYIAYILTIIHFSIRSFDEWSGWVANPLKSLPPMSLILLLFAIFVLGLRIAVFISSRRKTKSILNS